MDQLNKHSFDNHHQQLSIFLWLIFDFRLNQTVFIQHHLIFHVNWHWERVILCDYLIILSSIKDIIDK